MAIAIRNAALVLFLAGGLPFAAKAQSCIPDTTSDWMTSIPLSTSSAKVWPADCASVEQSPPDFSWPDLSADSQYQVTVTYADGRTRTLTAPQNWINWDEFLPAGSYTWQVLVTNAVGTQQSRVRRFTVNAGAVAFLVPDWTDVFNHAAAKPHPRALPDAATLQAMLNQRQGALSLLYSKVDGALGVPPQPEPSYGTYQDTISAQTYAECQRLRDSALAWLVSGNQAYLADALARSQSLASWDPHGTTAYASVDQVSRAIAGTLTLAYDWLYPQLTTDQKTQLLGSILARGGDMYSDVIGSRPRVATRPYDSHGNLTLLYLAAMSVVLAGDASQAQIGLRDALPLALHWSNPWGVEDGGFGSGTAYATWTSGDSLLAWYALRWAGGIDLAQKAWVRNHANFLAYFIPPGTPAGVFGDGAEMLLNENWARFGKAYTLFAPSPVGRWYASQLTGEDPTQLEILLAPPADSSPAPYPAGTPDSALFPSIGWAAMHSNLQDPARISVYFKSSPYGSYNHSHADQNSFAVNAGGQQLAIDSGYYDGYMTPHWWQWYKQTRAQNAITFDGGQGQVVYEQSGALGPGVITQYVHQSDHDVVAGDATGAYGGALTRAYRSLVYLRPNLIVVYDALASSVARRWEWNIHALNAMSVVSDQQISIQNNGQSLCVDLLAGPATQFTQTNQFSADPASWLGWTPQWHGAFIATNPSASTEFIALLRVGCTPATASASKANGVWTVVVGDHTVTFSGGV